MSGGQGSSNKEKLMKKCILGILTACAAMPAFADRIGDLEARLAQLEHRVAVLESGGNTVKIDLFGSNSTMYVCSVTPFQKTFEASDRNEGVARQKVRQACNRETSAMFCEDEAIRCRKFD